MTSTDYDVELFKQETDSVFIVLLTFSSDELTSDINIASDSYELLPTANVRGVLSNGIEYLYLPFEIRLPRDDKTGTITARLRIDNIDQTIISHLRSVLSPVTMDIKIVLSRDVDQIERHYQGFRLDNISYDSTTIEGDLTMDYWELEPFPSGRFTPSKWRGLF